MLDECMVKGLAERGARMGLAVAGMMLGGGMGGGEWEEEEMGGGEESGR